MKLDNSEGSLTVSDNEDCLMNFDSAEKSFEAPQTSSSPISTKKPLIPTQKLSNTLNSATEVSPENNTLLKFSQFAN